MGFSETIFLFFLALLVFGPKRLPEIARQVGKMMNELKRASNEFRSQIESEISNLELEKTRQILPSTQPSGTIENSPKTIEATPEAEPKAEPGSELQSLPAPQIPYAKAPDA
jgi:Tat protein translocase TatB subunit